MPEHWRWRVVLGLAAGVLAVLVLQRLVGGGGGDVRGAERPGAGPPAGAAARSPAVLRALRGNGVWLVFLTTAAADLPAAAAPAVAIAGDGRLRLLRPPPRSDGPRERWLAAGVVLPEADTAALDPMVRAAFLDVCSQLAGDRPMRADQVVRIGVRAAPGELERLLRWRR